MAKSRKSNVRDNDDLEDGWEKTEVDEFHENQEKILLNQAGIDYEGQNEEYEMSDEEVLGMSEEDDDLGDDELYGVQGNQETEDGDYNWGSSKNNYYGGGEEEEGQGDEDDEANAKLEEEEALRLQKKHLAALSAEDYFEEADLEDWKNAAKGTDEFSLVRENLPTPNVSELSDKERLKLMKKLYPEVIPLTKELNKYYPTLEALKLSASESKVDSIKLTALSSYLGVIYTYFALFVANIKEAKVDLKDHSIMEGILKARELWQSAEKLNYDSVGSDSVGPDDVESASAAFESGSADSASEYESAASDSADSADSVSDDEFDIEVPQSKAIKKAKRKLNSDFADESIGDDVDDEEKARRKRSLRFYTSKIDQKDKRSQVKYTGDIDLPYREREFERRQRLMEEARQRGLQSSNDAASKFDSDSDSDNELSKSINEGFAEDYYNEIKQESKQKKELKRKAHESAAQAFKEGKLAEMDDSLGENGKRAINYQILKNKGLTAKRNRDNNPRVKKRKKFDKALKKLPSIRGVYKPPTSAYAGEQTGIRKNVARSVKFA